MIHLKKIILIDKARGKSAGRRHVDGGFLNAGISSKNQFDQESAGGTTDPLDGKLDFFPFVGSGERI